VIGEVVKQTGELGLGRVEVSLCSILVRLLFGEQVVSKAHPPGRGGPGDVAQRRQTPDLSLRQEFGVLLDTRQLRSDKEAEAQKDQERNGQQDDEAFSDGHGFSSSAQGRLLRTRSRCARNGGERHE